MSKRTILGVQITNRTRKVADVQSVLTEYGCNIRTRLGLHEVSESACSTNGLLILDTYGDKSSIRKLEDKLKEVDGLVVKKMTFDI